MKAIAVHPGKRDSIHLREIPEPKVSEIPEGRGVKVKVLRVGVDGTDKEINAAEYGAAPPGDDYLVTGHESFGQVVEAGPNVPSTIRPGTYVVASVRRPGSSIYGKIGLQDFTTDDVYYERGINLLHGFLTSTTSRTTSTSSRFRTRSPRAVCCSSRRPSPGKASTTP